LLLFVVVIVIIINVNVVVNLLLFYFLGLKNLKSVNLSFTLVTDSGLKKLSGLTSIKYLNLDSRHITDAGLPALTCTYFCLSPFFEVIYAVLPSNYVC
jgi:Leucine Rich repeat